MAMRGFPRLVRPLLFLSFLMCDSVASQTQRRIHGTLSDAENGEKLAEVVVYTIPFDQTVPKIAGSSNAFGYYSIVVDSDNVLIGFSRLGYQDTLATVTPNQTMVVKLDVKLHPKPIYTEEVVVQGIRPLQKLQSPLSNLLSVHVDKYKVLPSIGGELDISKFLQLTPGVVVGQEGSNTLYVRGGSGDQNLIILDGARVYNPDHLFGFLSVFNADAIRDVSLLKGGIPAEYGGRLSSVYSVDMKDGAKDRVRFLGGVSLISSKVLLEGPISSMTEESLADEESAGSFMISARRTYVDPFLSLISNESPEQSDSKLTFYFYDVNARATYALNSNNRIFASAYFGNDVLRFSSDNAPDPSKGPNAVKNIDLDLDWGNYAYHIRFNSVWSPELFSNMSFVYSRYRFNSNLGFGTIISRKNPAITDLSFKATFEYAPNALLWVKAGTEVTQYRYEAVAGINELTADERVRLDAVEIVGFVSNELKITESMSSLIGLRATFFSGGKYVRAEPRVNLSYHFSETGSIKASYTQMNQFTHLLSSTSFPSPSDVWYPSTDFLRPQMSDQITLGWLQYFPGPSDALDYEFTVDIFFKTQKDLPAFRQSFVSAEEDKLRKDLIFGSGKSFGVELMLKKDVGAISGIVNYSFTHTERTFAERNTGLPFTPRFDRPHVFNSLLSYKISPDWTLSSTFVLTSGEPVTIPRQKYFISGPNGEYDADLQSTPIDYGEIYSYRLPPYNRMDVNATYSFQAWGGEWALNLSVYNIYNYPNPLFVDFNDPRSKNLASKTSVGLLPSIGIVARF